MKASIVIERNMEDVFEVISDPEKLYGLKENGWFTFDLNGPISAGSAFTAEIKMGPWTTTTNYEVTIYEPPFRLAFLIGEQPSATPAGWFSRLVRRKGRRKLPMQDIIELRSAPGGARLIRTFGIKSRIGRLVDIPLSPLTNWGMRRDLRRLKSRIESELP